MADTIIPTVVTVNAINTSITSVGVVIFGIHTGLDYGTLLAGVLGGAAALTYTEKDNLVKRAVEVITASLIAGYLSPVLGEIALYNLSKFDIIKETANTKLGIQFGIAAIVGYTAHGVILPGLRKLVGSLIRRAANE